jgi:hypothetical protein
MSGALARVYAFSISTCFGSRTVRISETFVRRAALIRVANVIFKTNAFRSVTFRLADGVDTTSFEQASILTISIDTNIFIKTLKVALASRFNTNGVGISVEANVTSTGRQMIEDITFCILATYKGGARIGTALLNACKMQGTFLIHSTFRACS